MMSELFDKRDPQAVWQWPDFTEQQMRCRGTHECVLNIDAMDRLEKLNDRMVHDTGRPLRITSAYRHPSYNKTIPGAAKDSYHIHRNSGGAFDIAIDDHDPAMLERQAKLAGFTGFGYYSTFLHADTGPKRTWGSRKQFLRRNQDGHLPEQERAGKDIAPTKDKDLQAVIGTAVTSAPGVISAVGGLQLPIWLLAPCVVLTAACVIYLIYRRLK